MQVMSQPGLRRYLPALLLACGLLAGCATPERLVPGADQATVLRTVGAPFERHRLADGERWVYPAGGLQQETWMVDLDPGGRVVRVRQVLDMAHFSRVRVGVDTEADVRREFGPPREVQAFARVNLTAWLYAYRESNMWNSEMAIYFDPQGIVRKVENGPDPRFLGNGNDRAQ
jgi:hypothetical protein